MPQSNIDVLRASYDQPIVKVDGYDVLCHFQAGAKDSKIEVGEAFKCRFCGENRKSRFRKVAHTFPQGLGNHWIISKDECDQCNKLFSKYDDSLCKSVGPILTLGGTTGKGNKVRQTGRSKGDNHIRHERQNGQRQISFQLLDNQNRISPAIDSEINFFADGKMQTTMPIPSERFVPRHAYKALAKAGLALLPQDELTHFSTLLSWVQSTFENEPFPFLDVGLSVGSLGNAPPLVSGTILRRKHGAKSRPYAIFILTAGSVCWQIILTPDTLDDNIGAVEFGCANICWNAILGPSDCDQIKIEYAKPNHFDWSSSEAILTPIEAIHTHFDQHTLEGCFEIDWRDMLPMQSPDQVPEIR